MADQERKYTYKLIDPDEIEQIKATEYLVQDLFVLGEITFVWGTPKHFKTFFVLGALLCVAMGISFFGRKVRQRKVLYMIGEGSDAFMGRVKSWQIFNKVPKLKKNFLVVPCTVNLFDDNSVSTAVKQVEDQGFKPDVLAIDPLGRAMGRGDENTKDFNQIFASLDRIRQEYWPGVTEIVVSHPKKGEDIFRGPQVIAADSDNFVYIKRSGKELSAQVSCGFARNAAEFEPFGFTMGAEKVMTTKGLQDFLVVNELTEVAAETVEKGTTEREKERKQLELDELAYKALLSLYKGPDSWTQWSDWLELTKQRRPSKKLGNDTFNDVVKRLVAAGRVRKNLEGLYQVVLGGGDEAAPDYPESLAPDAPAPGLVTPDSSLYKGGGVSGVGVTPRSTPGVSGVTPTRNGNGHSAVVPDKAQIALEQLLNKKPPGVV